MDRLMGRSYQITKNRINLDLFEIIQLCLQIDDLWRHLYVHATHQTVISN